ncbi:hypothetical protein [Kribbella albertanoniae]|uniref:DUF3558 domain-containing protein n=1 Tax=Kribbella albertanoniae TaxID=1266829 RepID=A0A4R4Q432_9ACTN|nr:hypothetical protein [Kribbella albertanoniae]TDC29818.1 hypothetical protein E1261_14895 [Kribbella albertanoniae]
MRALARIFVVMALLVVGSCSTGETSDPGPTRSAVPSNPDRDLGAVVAALSRIDPCALIDPARAKAPGFTVDKPSVQPAPSTCVVRGDQVGAVQVDLLTRFLGYDRWRGRERLIFGEAVGYLLQNGNCELVVPVSFGFAIRFEDRGVQPTKVKCGQLRAFAAAAVPLLAKPSATGPGRWDACSLLGRALGMEEPPYPQSLDRCEVTGKARLQLPYGVVPFDPKGHPERVTVAGRTAGLKSSGTECVLTMDQGPTGLRHPRPAFQQIVLAAPTCPEATKLATTVVELLRTPPPPSRVQAPLYFRPNEPEQAAPGGCAFVEFRTDFKDCEPYTSADRPKAAELHSKAQADPHVLCAIAVEPVRERFGDRLKPVVAGHRCHFLEGGGRLKVVISSSGDTLQPAPERALTIAGHPAEQSRGYADSHVFRIGLGKKSQLSIEYDFYTTREGPTPAPEDAAVLAKLESLVPAVVQQLN